MNIGETISIPHADYGQLTWTIIGKTENQITLWCEALPKKMPFSAPRDSQRYLRLDMAAKGHKGGAYPHGVLCDDVQMLSRAEIDYIISRESDERGKDESINDSKLRAAHLAEYGCNQWPVSALREYLNSEFLNGLPDEFRRAIIPATRDIILARGSVVRTGEGTLISWPDMRGKVEAYSEDISLYDSFEKASTKGNQTYYYRYTHAAVTDRVALLSRGDIARLDYLKSPSHLERFMPGSDMPSYYWLMNADCNQADLTESLAEVVVYTKGSIGKRQPYITGCNARAANAVCPLVAVECK